MSTTTEVYRTPDERFEGLPGYDFEPHYAEVGGLRMHYIDEGPADAEPIVCLHGEPSWSYLYRKMVGPLAAAGHRVICPDLVGFGRSDKPVDLDWYTYDAHCEHIAGLLNDVLDLHNVTLVVQDWGGMIGLRWAIENQDRVERLWIMNTGLYTGKVSKGFMAWRDFAERQGRELPVGFIIQGATTTELPDDIVAAYEAPWPGPESKAGVAKFPLLVPISDDSPGAKEMTDTREALRSWQKPARVAFSDSGPVFPYPKSGAVFTDEIPTAGEQVCIEGAAHFLQEDRGEQIAEEILRFIGETG
jgi:haloalkane dehalogenase